MLYIDFTLLIYTCIFLIKTEPEKSTHTSCPEIISFSSKFVVNSDDIPFFEV